MKLTPYRSIHPPKLPVPIMHEKEEIEVLASIVRKKAPYLFIEFGTGWGGLTLFLNQQFPNMEIVSFDTNYDTGIIQHLFSSNVAFVRQNVLNMSKLVIRLLNTKARKILYCDNGDRVSEINMYAPFLSSGDILGVHDYDMKIEKGISKTIKSFSPYARKHCIKEELSIRLWIKE
jgi:cephalosporin hydroxylase